MKNLHIFFPNLALIIKLKSPSIINKSIINMISHITLKTKQKSINDMDIFFYFSFCLSFVDVCRQVDIKHAHWSIDLSLANQNKGFQTGPGPRQASSGNVRVAICAGSLNRAGFGPSCWGKNWRAGVRIFTFIK